MLMMPVKQLLIFQFSNSSKNIQIQIEECKPVVDHNCYLSCKFSSCTGAQTTAFQFAVQFDCKIVTHAICKYLMLDSEGKNQQNLKLISNFIKNAKRQQNLQMIIYQWVGSVLFNVAAMNEEYMQEMQEYLMKQKSQHIQQALTNLSQISKTNIQIFINDEEIIEMVNNKIQKKLQRSDRGVRIIDKMQDPNILHTFLTTLQYLLNKFEINAPYQPHLSELIRIYTENRIGDLNDKVRYQCNRLLFYGTSMVIHLQEKLDKNYNTNLSAISSLIDANYYKLETPRNIFCLTAAQSQIEKFQSGQQIVREIFCFLIKNSTKNHVFSQKMLQTERLFVLAVKIIQFRHLDILLQWNHSVFQNCTQKKIQYSSITTKIINFLCQLPITHKQYTELMRYLFDRVCEKHSKPASVEIMKKLMLNRFLLNPELYKNYIISSKDISATLNEVRILFYPKKLSQNLITLGQRVHQIFQKFLIPNNKNKNVNDRMDRNCEQIDKNSIYRLDKQLYRDYQTIYDDLLSNNRYQRQSFAQRDRSASDFSYQLSFSFLKKPNNQNQSSTVYQFDKNKNKNINDQSKYTALIPKDLRSPTSNPQNNNSMNTLLDNIKSQKSKEKSHGLLGSPNSVKSRKTLHTEFSTERNNSHKRLVTEPISQDVLTELVGKRRQLGAARRQIQEKRSKKQKKRQKWTILMDKVHERFQQRRRDIQITSNKFRINSELI